MPKHSRAPRVWIYMADPKTIRDIVNLAHESSLTWGANPFTSKGDIVLMYRCAPFSDIAYAFTALSAPRTSVRADGTDAKHAIELGAKVALIVPITFKEIKRETSLADWAFARNPQGVMQRKRDITAEGTWPALLRLITRSNPDFQRSLIKSRKQLRLASSLPSRHRAPEILNVFISYAHEDREFAIRLCNRLRKEGFIDPWFDVRQLAAGEKWEHVIQQAIRDADAAVVGVTTNTQHQGFIRREIGLLKAKFPTGSRKMPTLYPVKFARCDVPQILSDYHHVELYKPGTYDHLIGQLQKLARTLATKRGSKERISLTA